MRNAVMCVACLATNVRMYSISPDHLLQAYLQVLGRPICSYMPQMLCWECAGFLNRFMWFRGKCERAYRLLEGLHEQGQEFTEDCVKESERARYDLSSSLMLAVLVPQSPIQSNAANNNIYSQDMQGMSIKCEPGLEGNGSLDSKDTFFSAEYVTQETVRRDCASSRLSSLTFSEVLFLSVISRPNLTRTPVVVEECDGCVSTEPVSSLTGGDLDVGVFQERFVEFAINFRGNRSPERPGNIRKKKIQRMKNEYISSQHEPKMSLVNDGVPKDIHNIILLDGDDSTLSSGSVHTDIWPSSIDSDACALEVEMDAEEEMNIAPPATSGGEGTHQLIPGWNINKRGSSTTENKVKKGLRVIRKGSKSSKLTKVRKNSLLEEVLRSERKSADPNSLLTNREEDRVVDWILCLSNTGFPITKYTLIEAILEFIGPARQQTFGASADSWYLDFLFRNPDLASRIMRCAETSEATEWSVRIWFNLFIKWDIVVGELQDVFKDPRRVFHSEESAIPLCPDSDLLVKNNSNKPNSGSEIDIRLTISLTISADGSMQPPLVLFPYECEVPESIRGKMPPFWTLGKSKTGRTNGTSFYNYTANVFYPWLKANQIPLPVILFLDGCTSYINVQLLEFCKQKGIYLTALLPNSHRFKPLHCAVLRPLKRLWVNHVRKWRMETGKELKQEDFCAEMDICLKQSVTSIAIQEAFRRCGLYPLNPLNIDFLTLMAYDKADRC